jgi:uncharacterized membrane protein (DUF106 family)
MRRGRVTYFVLFALAVSLAFHITPGSRSSIAQAGVLDEKFAELEQMQKEINEFQKQIDSRRRTENSVVKELERLEMQLTLSQKELDYMIARIQYLRR